MSQVKNLPGIKVFYSDTDSIHTNKPLPAHLVSDTKLGLFKLEQRSSCTKAIYLAPKVYGLLDNNGNQIIKVKGLSKKSLESINIDTLESLLKFDSKNHFEQEKWFNSIKQGNITIKNQKYTLNVTGNKRHLMYENNLLVALRSWAKPLTIDLNKSII